MSSLTLTLILWIKEKYNEKAMPCSADWTNFCLNLTFSERNVWSPIEKGLRMMSMLKLRNSNMYPLLCCVVSNMWWYSPMTNNNRGWHWWAHYYPGIGDSYVGSLWYRHHTAHRGYSEIFNYTWGCKDTGAHDWWHMSLDCNAETEPMFHVSVFNILE